MTSTSDQASRKPARRPPSGGVRLRYYRWQGRFLFFRIKTRCEACDIANAVLQQLMSGPFRDKPVTLEVAPWLDNWWRIIWLGAWHAPIVMVDRQVFSQGVVPEVKALVLTVAEHLEDPDLAARAQTYRHRTPTPAAEKSVQVYFSPACPHCLRLRAYLDANGVDYDALDVTRAASARQAVKRLTGKLTIPVTVVRGKIVVGLDKSRLRNVLGIRPGTEKEGPPPATRRPRFRDHQLHSACGRARQILRRNCTQGRTRASRHLYPHQWNWDAGFIARGYLHFDPGQAYGEIRQLFKGQWSDGFLPHIVFNEHHLDHFPGPDYWRAERSGRVPPGVHTSGISQPPVHASMLLPALSLDPEKGRASTFLREMYPRLCRLHEALFSLRDPAEEGLVYLVHPWESGIDNAPIWDEPLSAVKESSAWAREMQARYDELSRTGQRPQRAYIEKYSYLVQNLYEHGYDWKALTSSHPFQIQDVLFNSVLCRAEHDLALVAEHLGRDPAPHRQRVQRMVQAMNETLWDPDAGIYYSRDRRSGQHIKRDTIFSYLPLYAGVCDASRCKTLVDHLRSHCFCVADRDCVGLPSYDMCQTDYEGEFYWRGPVWFNMCWYMVEGLHRYGEHETAEWLTDSLLQLVIENGFHEYYEPETGKGLGAGGFSWTAALFIDLAAQRAARRSGNPASGVRAHDL